MKVLCHSDIHGFLIPPEELPDADLLLLAGDYSPNTKTEYEWTYKVFVPWLQEVSKRMPIKATSGNHDFLYERNPELIPRGDYWEWFNDAGTEFMGFKLYFSSWQKRFYDWAFNLDEVDLAKKWKLIPDDTNILITHSPVYGFGDYSPYGKEMIGSPSLLERIKELEHLKLHVWGHAHSGAGSYRLGDKVLINASHVSEDYKPIHPPILIEL